MIKGFAALTTETADQNLRLTEYESQQVAEYAHEMVDQMIKRVEEAFKTEFCKPTKWGASLEVVLSDVWQYSIYSYAI